MSAPAAAADLAPRSRAWADSESPSATVASAAIAAVLRRRARQKGKSPAARSLRARPRRAWWPARFHRAGARGGKGSPPRRGRFAPARGGLGGRRDFIAPARAAEVVSSNIVGYEKINVPVNSQDIIGIQFQNVGGDGSLSIQNIKTEGFGDWGDDWIKVYDPSTSRYTTARFYGEDAGGVYLDDTYDEDTKLASGWGDTDQIAVGLTLDAGQGVWTQAESGGKVIVSGEVTSGNTVSVPVNSMTLVANPLPMSVNIQKIKTEGYGDWGDDWIKVYDPSTSLYTTARYYGEDAGGVYLDDTYDEDTKLASGWGDTDQIVVNLTIEAGQGFWTQAENGGILTFPALPAE